MTAYIGCLRNSTPRRTPAPVRGTLLNVCACCVWPRGAALSHGGRPRTVPQVQANPVILACVLELGQTKRDEFARETERNWVISVSALKKSLPAWPQGLLLCDNASRFEEECDA